jgi:hypothetical protein
MFLLGDRIKVIKSPQMDKMKLSGMIGTVQERGNEDGFYRVIMDDYKPSHLLLKEDQMKLLRRK